MQNAHPPFSRIRLNERNDSIQFRCYYIHFVDVIMMEWDTETDTLFQIYFRRGYVDI